MAGENAAGTATETAKPNEDGAQKRERSSIAFPYLDLNDAVGVALAVHRNVGTGACSADQLAPWLGLSPSSSGFRLRLSTARLFGLITPDGNDSIALLDLGMMVADPRREREARATAFMNVPLYRALFEKYKGLVLPPTAALEREIVSLGVAEKQKDRARSAFERSAEQAGYFESGRDRLVRPGIAAREEATALPEHDEVKNGNRGGGGDGLNLDPLLIELLRKIPPADEGWPAAKRVRWFRTFAMNVSEIYDAEGEPVELEIKIEGQT